MKKSASPNYLLYVFSYTFSLRFLDFTILWKQRLHLHHSSAKLFMGWCLLTPFQLSLFADADVCWYKKKKGIQNCNIHHRTSLMKLVIGILILDRPPNLAISWPCFKRMVILSITTYLIPYNYFLPFFSLLGTVAIKWTNSSEKFSIN